ncbi:nuclear protein 96-domain-containing protein [Triangularia verruculosa]|uniref:Nuclear protein 96-domain-containing protein n=1 Tax=Triangularia verruculosa TaxID=2587418 RepID=A0AAN6XJR5_9PEZI|nr:nuclear protein 96-domain-containing protein [Triangularia verruculosa]
MAFGGFGGGGGGGGFGQNNNTTGSTFGGFGATNNTASGTGFGANNPTAGTTGGSLFGGGGTTGGFGAGTTGGAFGGGGFGAAKPAFGTPASTGGGGLFGSTTATAGGTGFGFGNTANAATTSTPFGGGGGSSLFGGAKPATTGFDATGSTFGAGATGGSLFGGGATTTTGTGFGATNNPGIGTATGEAPGTAVVAFSPLVEKEPNNPAQSNSFQNVMFMDAYKRWSGEELRLVDYNQGRKSGGATGSTFGSTNFGGFGGTSTTTGTGFGTGATTGGGLFGGGGATGGGFGAATATPAAATGGFGGGGLFGAKPAATSGGLFGTTPAQPAATGGGLFGGGGGGGGGFGTTGTTTGTGFGAGAVTAGGGLFGSNAAAAAKPASGFSFGGTGTTTAGTGFGGTATAGTGGSLFGGAQQQPAATGGGLFGNAQQQQQPAATGFGGFGAAAAQPAATGGGLFGAKPAATGGGLFGATTTTPATGGLFGGTQQQPAATGFGGAAAQPAAAGGGLFGAKPATTGGLFGTSTTTGTGGGLFGGAQQQPAATGGGLFGGGLAQNNQAKPSLFGGSTPAAGGLFSQPAQQQGGSLFGASTQAQPQTGFGNSLLGASQQQQQQQQQQGLSTSINDLSAYGAATLFSGLGEDRITNPGPLATPLGGKPKAKSRSILPMYKLSPANASRFVTPQKRGYGFSYSAYGSPATPSSISSTPGGLGQSLLASSVNRGLSKSISASNLRRSFNVEDSILQPGAFSAHSSMRLLGGTNSHKKLIINKDMRSDLFSTSDKKQAQEDGARKLSKRVSFDTSTADSPNGDAPAAITDGTENDNLGYLKPSIRPSANGTNGNKPSPVAAAPEMAQVKGNELAIVHEEESPVSARVAQVAKSPSSPASVDEPGEYWMSPSLEELRAMNRMQRQKVVDFTVGRVHVGNVQFKVPVDLSNINVDEIVENIVILVPRSATVYPVAAKKPPVGKGLNVPAIISLEHSWPRGGREVSGRRLEKHIQKLKSIPDTTFEDYDPETGVWQFSVEHFTTYGLDDDDSDEEFEEEAVVRQPVQLAKLARPEVEQIPSPSIEAASTSPVDPDDTFEFKRSRRTLPGAFDDNEAAMFDDEEDSDVAHHQGTPPHEPLDADTPIPSREWPEDESMADGPDDYQLEPYEDSYEYEQGSVDAAQDEFPLSRYDGNDEQVPAGIVRAQMRALKKSTAPTKIEVAGGDDWTQILQASVRAPRTVDRATLRELNETGAVWDMKDRGSPAPKDIAVDNNDDGFATSLDLMKSLFQQTKGGPTQSLQASPAKGFVKWPYQTRPKLDKEESRSVPRPNWGPDGVLVTAHDGEANLQAVDGSITPGGEAQVSTKILAQLQQYVDSVSGYQGDSGPEFKKLAQGDSVWELASLLFDDNGNGLPGFWRQLVLESTKTGVVRAESAEEKAIVCLAGNLVPEACVQLIKGRDMRLATLVAGIGSQQQDIKAQLRDWRESNVLSEISEPVRAIYELLAGNACVCDGVKDAPIESRAASFTISQRFGLDWTQAFGLRLFYTAGAKEGGPNVAEAIRSFQSDIEQDREPEPGSPLWSLLKAYANQEFDWSDSKLGWLMTRAIHASGKVNFGEDDVEKLDMASLSFASALTAQGHWIPAAFVLLQLSDKAAREKAVRDHLGRHAGLIGAPRNPDSAFNSLKKFGVPEAWVWEAKALDYRSRGETHQEFLALVWAKNYTEANRAFVNRVGPDLVIARDFKKLATYAQLLFKVKKNISDWDRAAVVYLLYPMVRQQTVTRGEKKKKQGEELDRMDEQLFDGLVALRGMARGDLRQEAAIADMAEELIKVRGGEARLYGLLPKDVAGRYRRAEALGGWGV